MTKKKEKKKSKNKNKANNTSREHKAKLSRNEYDG